jgi:transcriptional regulator with XRE-family HTH domain
MKKVSKKKSASKIGANVKKFKKEKGFSKSDLVRKTGLDYHTIAKIERGVTPDPRIGTVVKIALALEKTVEQLVN